MDRTLALRCLTAAALIGVASQALFFRTAIGINVVLVTLAVLAAALVVAWPAVRIDRLDWWLPPSAALVIAMLAIRADPTLALLDGLTGFVLVGAAMAAISGGRVTRRSIVAITVMGFMVLGWVAAGILRVVGHAKRRDTSTSDARRLPPVVRRVLRGLLIAAPILLVFWVLFVSADAIFESWSNNLFAWHVDLGQLPERVSIAFLVGWVVAGLLAVASGLVDVEPSVADPGAAAVAPPMQSLGAAVAAAPSRPAAVSPRLGNVEALTVLVAVSVLFAVFVVLQVAYLFGGLDTLSAGGITYSSYARRGFFELVAATGLAGGLVLVLNALVERRTRAFVAAALVLAGLTAMILASAALRLRLYQDAYGWTELRFYVYATIGWFGILIVGGAILLLRDQLRWIAHLMAISAVVVLVAVNVVGPQRHVAEANVARLLDPALVPEDGFAGLDTEYLAVLGDDAVPALVTALPYLAARERALVNDELRQRWRLLSGPEMTSWPAWNLGRERARDAIQGLFGR